jgi:hypothetical protein
MNPGDRIELVSMTDQWTRLTPGEKGTVEAHRLLRNHPRGLGLGSAPEALSWRGPVDNASSRGRAVSAT